LWSIAARNPSKSRQPPRLLQWYCTSIRASQSSPNSASSDSWWKLTCADANPAPSAWPAIAASSARRAASSRASSRGPVTGE